ncbi:MULTISPECIES: TorF family putative porin [Dyella]|uniref:Choline dehydrogenase n=2 Tax=Dyella TaxID=231454 RepID=A0A4R0YLH2_9GAMM|nr:MULTISPECIES: TorF family putative porin [Dyella]TBR36620.1 hypothetical protein EYV96_11865 [Dyella terrae]TCI08288.1 hypothetical protein EZM97_27005 [Dyella soli]
MNYRSSLPLSLLAALGCLASTSADAETTVTGNVAVTSDYLFRGLTQTWAHPAIQGGADLSLDNGFAAGTWASSVSDHSYPHGSMEWDVYASYGTSFGKDWSWRAGVYGYLYPGAELSLPGMHRRSFDTAEANVSLTWKYVTLKYNQALTDYFGVDVEQGYRGDSRGTSYLQVDASVPLSDAWSLLLHAGHTHYTTTLVTPLANGARDPGYSDASVAAKYQISTHVAVTAGLSYADNHDFYGKTCSFMQASTCRDVGGSRVFVTLQGTF